jgi:hypothetical protein
MLGSFSLTVMAAMRPPVLAGPMFRHWKALIQLSGSAGAVSPAACLGSVAAGATGRALSWAVAGASAGAIASSIAPGPLHGRNQRRPALLNWIPFASARIGVLRFMRFTCVIVRDLARTSDSEEFRRLALCGDGYGRSGRRAAH